MMIKNFHSGDAIQKLRENIRVNSLPNFINIDKDGIKLNIAKRVLVKRVEEKESRLLFKKFFQLALQIYC